MKPDSDKRKGRIIYSVLTYFIHMRDIENIKIEFFFKEQFESLRNLAPNVDAGKLSQLLSCAHALITQEAIAIGLPDFPLDSLSAAALILVNFLFFGSILYMVRFVDLTLILR